jgi:hypothetical protein
VGFIHGAVVLGPQVANLGSPGIEVLGVRTKDAKGTFEFLVEFLPTDPEGWLGVDRVVVRILPSKIAPAVTGRQRLSTLGAAHKATERKVRELAPIPWTV